MGKIKGGVNGNLSGVAGNVVFYSLNGQNYFRTLPKRRSKNSWSERQVQNRERFAALLAFWRQFSFTPLKMIWQVAEEGKRALNLFISTNSPAFGPDGALVDPERLHFSAGHLPLPHKMSVKAIPGDPGSLQINWQDDPGTGNARSDDELRMMVLQDGKFTGPVATGVFRKTETAVIKLPSETVQGLYLFFASDKRKLYSPDVYFAVNGKQ